MQRSLIDVFFLTADGHSPCESQLRGFHQLTMELGGPLLGVDVGTRHVGLAFSDKEHLVSFPHMGFERSEVAVDVQRVRTVASSRGIRCGVVGMPVAPDGSSCASLQRFVRAYSERVLAHAGLKAIAYWDEGFTTVMARDIFMRSVKKSERNSVGLRKRRIDAVCVSCFLRMCD